MPDDRRRFSTGNPWERQAGFSRAIRVGNTVYTAGTIAVDQEGVTQGVGCYEQCAFITRKLENILTEAGSCLGDIVQVRAYLIDKADIPEFVRFQGEFFGEIAPAATAVIVKDLFGEGCVVELEFVAVISS